MYKIVNKDLFEVELPKSKLLLTDIPYGEVNRADNGLRNLNKEEADELNFDEHDFLEHIYDSADIFVIFCGAGQFSKIYNWFDEKSKKKQGTVRPLIWKKTNPSPNR